MVREVSDDCPNRRALMPHVVVLRPQGRRGPIGSNSALFLLHFKGIQSKKAAPPQEVPSIALQCPDALGLIEP
jgi:hypothetical protein